MTRSHALNLLLVVLMASAFVVALEQPRGRIGSPLVTGGYAVAVDRLLPPRAQPYARNVQHSSSSVAT